MPMSWCQSVLFRTGYVRRKKRCAAYQKGAEGEVDMGIFIVTSYRVAHHEHDTGNLSESSNVSRVISSTHRSKGCTHE